ncbi:M28 family peptidase [candidate division KSB1 bacterium]|nr:M28 family peptidase [candidate division KSB1 bacterium]
MAEQCFEMVTRGNIARHLFYLAKEPLPCRIFNYTRPGCTKCTLYEADDYIRTEVQHLNYDLVEEHIPVQSFVPDTSVPHGFRKPLHHEPWFDAVNIYARKAGTLYSEQVILLLAHKDSQSWLPCAAGAYDNAIGTAALLELARLFGHYPSKRSIWFLFCNEEHWPWTSVKAAKKLAAQHLQILAVINIDSIGGKAIEDSVGRMTQVTRYSTREGKKIALLLDGLNKEYKIGLHHKSCFLEQPNDDDGSFINAGILPAVMAIGSYPYQNPAYHTTEDTADKVDLQNAVLSTKLIAAAIQHIDEIGNEVMS